ncbi:hypothetical protein QOZ80_6AG0525290 [Eleusine coracana subsp. coracana]|nr:hypothetical protein QOZ80_6AG0525290 [Eleusine coracana subsp. coracana]
MAIGDGATMAFVDLWRGILLCNLHQVEKEAHMHGNSQPLPVLRYVLLPQPLQMNKSLKGDANLYQNIAIVNNRLKYVELQLHWKPSVVCRGYLTDGWMAAIFSRPISCLDHDGWRRDCKMDSKELNVHGNPQFELLPKLLNDEGMSLPPFKRLDVCQPVLGLQDDADVLYFTTKINRSCDDAWVTAVDMRKKKLLGVAPFAGGRTVGINFAYVQSKNVGDDRQDMRMKKFRIAKPPGYEYHYESHVGGDDEEFSIEYSVEWEDVAVHLRRALFQTKVL